MDIHISIEALKLLSSALAAMGFIGLGVFCVWIMYKAGV